ncbi:MAG: OB-fold nucleic acid binding domain-containing protein [Halolamina sp.]
MGNCIICGTDVDGHICDSHEEDVVFEFRGDSPDQLVSGRYYHGTVDGYADFGVFVDVAPSVTGLLHRSELDRRLESLDWEPGDDVFVQVKNVRDNDNIDLAWSIRQDESRFRGSLVQEGDDHRLAKESEESEESEEDSRTADEHSETPSSTDEAESAQAQAGTEAAATTASGAESGASEAAASAAAEDAAADDIKNEAEAEAEPESEGEPEAEAETGADPETDADRTVETGGRENGADYDGAPTDDGERVAVERLNDLVGEAVRIEGEVVGARQTGGPTVFELRDETGVVDCAAFVEAGVRAYPEIEVGDIVRLDGEVELRRNEIQVETDALAALDGDAAATVQRRLADALTDEARPETATRLADREDIAAAEESLLDAAEAIRRAVLEGRPIVVRHGATADGYVAGAAIERAVLPLVRDEHSKSDAEYHYFDRRPLDEAAYDMDAATNDVTRMLEDRDRHDEKLPLVLLVGTGATVESADGLGLLDVYGAKRAVVDAGPADDETTDLAGAVVAPDLADADAADLSTGALAATLAATVNEDVTDDLTHLPAVSYWEDAPEAYVDLAADAGYDAERVAELREAVALEAFYQSYEDKRELITDLLFGDAGAGATADAADPESLASHVAAQFREKMATEVETAAANVERHETGGVSFAVLDAEAYTHEYDFPPTPLLCDELHRRLREDGVDVTLGVAADELWIRAAADLDVRAVADDAAELSPEAGLTAHGIREGRLEFLAGVRDDVEDAVVAAITDHYY